MPYFTLHRNYVLRTTKGHSIGFAKGEKTWVPPACVPDVVAIGAVPEESVDVLPEEEKPAVQLTHDDRQRKIWEAFDLMIERNERGDFTASGLPNAKKVWGLTGFEVGNAERDAAWMAYQQAKAEA